MGAKITRQFLVERRYLRSTVGQLTAAQFDWAELPWELVGQYSTLEPARQQEAILSEAFERHPGFVTRGAEFRLRRVDTHVQGPPSQ